MGIIDLRKFGNYYFKFCYIYEWVFSIIESYLFDELVIEVFFFGKNVQLMLKFGCVQGVVMVVVLSCDIFIIEYVLLKIKMVIIGNGQVFKE